MKASHCKQAVMNCILLLTSCRKHVFSLSSVLSDLHLLSNIHGSCASYNYIKVQCVHTHIATVYMPHACINMHIV